MVRTRGAQGRARPGAPPPPTFEGDPGTDDTPPPPWGYTWDQTLASNLWGATNPDLNSSEEGTTLGSRKGWTPWLETPRGGRMTS